MAFDLAGFARDLLALSGHDELLACARRTVQATSGQPAFAAHVLPGRAWQQATVLAPEGDPRFSDVAVRSALFAVHRRLSMSARTLWLARGPDTEPLFRALAPSADITRLLAVPLRNRGDDLTGALVAAQAGEAADAQHDLETIASLVGPAMEAAWRHTLARREQERLQLLSETTEESLWDWNITDGEVWWGGNLAQMLGARTRVSRRADWRRARIHADDVERVIASFETALAGDESSWSEEYRMRGVDEDVIHVREHVYFLREVDGRAYRAIGTVRDITALQLLLEREMQARATAERASAVKDEFLAMLGHELRNPLAPIVSVLTVLERRANGPDRSLEILRRQTQHLVRLVDDLLDVSRISSGKVELTRLRMPLVPLVQRALEMVQPLVDQRRHRVVVDVPPALEIEADAARMTQVLSNLLVNAAKYTEPGGLVQVTAEAADGMVTLRIRDDGIGIAPDVLPTIFDLFTQGRQAPDRAQGGLGLGLSIVRNIVVLHGGTVQAHSDGVGRGTEVELRLPLARASAPAEGTAPSAAAHDVVPRQLLIVDDNEDAAALLQELLTHSGHAVRVAHHPADALRLFAERGPDVALIDIGLPGMDGYELVRRLRAEPGGAGTRFVALTGYGLASDKAKAHAAGFDSHLVKPVSPERLAQVINTLTLPA